MIIKLQTCTDDARKLDKLPELVKSITGNLTRETSLTDPEIVISGSLTNSQMALVNYLTIDELRRSYFVSGIREVRTGVWVLQCHVDVLSSFKGAIRLQTGVIKRQENSYNLYLPDPDFKTYQDPVISVQEIPGFLSSDCLVMALASGGPRPVAPASPTSPEPQAPTAPEAPAQPAPMPAPVEQEVTNEQLEQLN